LPTAIEAIEVPVENSDVGSIFLDSQANIPLAYYGPVGHLDHFWIAICALHFHNADRADLIRDSKKRSDRWRRTHNARADAELVRTTRIGCTAIGSESLGRVIDINHVDSSIDKRVLKMFPWFPRTILELTEDEFHFTCVLEAHLPPRFALFLHPHFVIKIGELYAQLLGDALLGLSPHHRRFRSRFSGPLDPVSGNLTGQVEILLKVRRRKELFVADCVERRSFAVLGDHVRGNVESE
jgi:hypothetical protein